MPRKKIPETQQLQLTANEILRIKHTQFTAKENLGNITHATCREGKSWNGELSELTQEKNLRNKDDFDPGGVDAEEAPGNIRQ